MTLTKYKLDIKSTVPSIAKIYYSYNDDDDIDDDDDDNDDDTNNN